ncbi:TlpA family protein disulfide reductase [Legionella sp. PATHC032]|uniref:TlpA disulfide reductase family protein n=1 Tax=Legionella sp. PATHC032 TaxID=2992039 RepID=UPI001AFCF9FE|nr:TlpA disulfide reductase family protein [Legionella sp. PATHC032]MCW8420028.1 TlpA family protein disulfide reductase [Legionella sp. PATHC032]HAZ7574315.1 TlpA family protein disulfide reductase [Legionella pneumophila]HBA1635439.1 TlpA family protein disulfide reductase [Legionella pneumophila]
MKRLIPIFIYLLILAITPFSTHAEALLKDNFGHNIPFSSLKGKWVFINYWASWCETCVDEIPEFNRFYKNHKKDAVALYAVNYDALPLPEQKLLIKKFNINYPNLLKDPAQDLQLGDITGVPVTFVFNPKGQLIKKLYGGQTAETLEKIIEKYRTS